MFLVLLAMGVVDLGRGVFLGIAIEDAAREGAHYASFTEETSGGPLTTADITARVVAALDSPTIDPAQVSVTCVDDPRSRRDGTRITVAVTHQVELVTPFMDRFFGGSLTVSRSATVHRFFPGCPSGSVTP
jgi:hypothetical protein